MQKRVNQLKCTKPPSRRQLLIHKKSKNGKIQKDKIGKTQKEQNMQKEQKNKNCTFAPAISTCYTFRNFLD